MGILEEENTSTSVIASIDLSGALNALSLSPTGNLIAVGGRDVLKIIHLDSNCGFIEKRNLRVGKANLNLSTNDIDWNPLSDHSVATGATNGTVIIWNLNREGVRQAQEYVFSEHHRAVNRVRWHPSDSCLLLTGSQDGTIKLWDKRGSRPNTFYPKSESVRDICFNPFQRSKFAVAFENGYVQVWDFRKPTVPEIKFQAHKGLVLSVDWHPERQDILATGSRDRTIKIWNTQSIKSPEHSIQTISSVGRIQWRPFFSGQIASCASLMDSSIHVWDIIRKDIPIATMKGHVDVASGIKWLDTPSHISSSMDASQEKTGTDYWQHIIACSKDGSLKLHSLEKSYKPYKNICNIALSLNTKGLIAASSDHIDRSDDILGIRQYFNINNSLFCVSTSSSTKQLQEEKSLPSLSSTTSISISSPEKSTSQMLRSKTSTTSLNTITYPSIPRSSSFDSSFQREVSDISRRSPAAMINIHQLKGKYSLQSLQLKFKSIITETSHQQDKLQEQSENETEAFGFNEIVFRFLAQNYLLFNSSFQEICLHNAKAAEIAKRFHVSQMWQILYLMFSIRAEENLNPSTRVKSSSSKTQNAYKYPDLNNSTCYLLQQLDDANPEAMHAFESSHEESTVRLISSNDSSSDFLSGDASMKMSSQSIRSELGNIMEDIFRELLDYYTELGDVQNCVAILCAISALNNGDMIFKKKKIQELFMHYIELLHHLQMFTEANLVIKQCRDDSIRQMNMKSTTVYSNCSNCNKHLDNIDATTDMQHQSTCQNCQNIAGICSICQQKVQGLYVWCSICSHGGHIYHMKEWYSNHDMCPTGCGHQCTTLKKRLSHIGNER